MAIEECTVQGKLYITTNYNDNCTIQCNENFTVQRKIYSTTKSVQYSEKCTVQRKVYSTTQIVQYNESCTVQRIIYNTTKIVCTIYNKYWIHTED